jgi:hypothetical protein
MQIELKVKAYYVVDTTGYWIVEPGSNKRIWFKTQEEADGYLERTQEFTIFPNAPLSVVTVDIAQVLDSDTLTETAELVITSKILEDSLKRMSNNYNEMIKEYSPVRDLKNLIKNFEKHIGYNKLINVNATNLKEYVKDIVEIPSQPYYNKLIEEHFSKLQPKEDNLSFNIYKAFEDKKKEIEDSWKVNQAVTTARSTNDKSVDSFKVKLKEETIIPYFIEYFKISLLVYTDRVESLSFEEYEATKDRYAFLNNLLAYNAKNIYIHNKNIDELTEFVYYIKNRIEEKVYDKLTNKEDVGSYKDWVNSLTDDEYNHYFGIKVVSGGNEFTITSLALKAIIEPEGRVIYAKTFVNIFNKLSGRYGI